MRIDSHAHVFHRGLTLASARRYAPDYDAPLEAFTRELDAHGITHAVLVQPSFLGADNSYLTSCLMAAAGRLRGVAVVEPDTQRHELLALDQAGVVGIRLNLLGQSLPDLYAPSWRDLLACVQSLGWFVEIQRGAADLALLATTVMAQGIRVVIDHYGLPDPKLGVADPAFAALLALGASGKVYVKLSAPYRTAPDGADFARRAWPLLREAFGAEHLMWGSDWPHTRFEPHQTYASNLDFLRDLVPDAAEQEAILASPQHLLRW